MWSLKTVPLKNLFCETGMDKAERHVVINHLYLQLVLHPAMLCNATHAVPRSAVLCHVMPCCAVLYHPVLCCALPCCIMLCCAVLCHVVLCCAVLCCAVLCCAVLCCAVLSWHHEHMPVRIHFILCNAPAVHQKGYVACNCCPRASSVALVV